MIRLTLAGLTVAVALADIIYHMRKYGLSFIEAIKFIWWTNEQTLP